MIKLVTVLSWGLFYKVDVHDESFKWISNFNSSKFDISLVWLEIILYYYLDLFT